MKSKEIETLNKWLIEKSKKVGESGWWREYYLSLQDIDSNSDFTISSGDFTYLPGKIKSPLERYLDDHDSEYIKYPMTGSCRYIKKELEKVPKENE